LRKNHLDGISPRGLSQRLMTCPLALSAATATLKYRCVVSTLSFGCAADLITTAPNGRLGNGPQPTPGKFVVAF